MFILRLKVVVVAKLLTLGTSYLTSFILPLRVVLIAKFVIPGISSSIFLILVSYPVFLRTSFFTTLLSLLESTGAVSNFGISDLSALLSKLLKPLGTFFNFSISNFNFDFKH